MKSCLLFLIISLLCCALRAQVTFDFLFSTEYEDKINYVYQDTCSDEQLFIYTKERNSNDPGSDSRRFIYLIDIAGDTSRLPFIDERNDTLFSANQIIKEANGDYFLTGIAWTPDTNSYLWHESDYCIRWNSDCELIWECIHSRPSHSPIDSLSKSSNFKTLKLRNGNYLVAKSIFTLERYVVLRYYLLEIDQNTGEVVKERLSHQLSSYVQGLTYNHDSSNILLHIGRTWLDECKRNSCGAFILDTTTYDTIGSYCYNRDDDDPYKYWCVHVPYNAHLKENGNLILSGTGDCSTVSGPGEDYLFIYEYDTAFQLINRAFYTDPDTIYDAGWYESMAFTSDNEILLAGNHDRMQLPFSSYYNYIYLAKVDSDLKLISERYIGGDAEYIVLSMDATMDGGMIVSGTRYDFMINDDEHDAFILKTDENLMVNIDDYPSFEIHSAIVYPNPGASSLNIRTTEYPSTFVLVDIYGRHQTTQLITKHITQISVLNLVEGTYIWTLSNNGLIIDQGKWIKNK